MIATTKPTSSAPEASHRVSATVLRYSLLVLGCVSWLAVVIASMGWLTGYANDAGRWAEAPARLDDATTRQARLLIFVHPRCPCTAASIGELARIAARCGSKLSTTAYLYVPRNEADGWADGANRRALESIPGVQIVLDRGGATAESFGALTSGDVRLYDPTGKLKFQGGITSARGHEGDNRGKSAVLAMVAGDKCDVGECPVFGCSLRAEGASNDD